MKAITFESSSKEFGKIKNRIAERGEQSIRFSLEENCSFYFAAAKLREYFSGRDVTLHAYPIFETEWTEEGELAFAIRRSFGCDEVPAEFPSTVFEPDEGEKFCVLLYAYLLLKWDLCIWTTNAQDYVQIDHHSVGGLHYATDAVSIDQLQILQELVEE